VRLYTVHGEPPREVSGPEGWPEPPARPPILLREGFNVWAFLLGFLWFLFNRLWWEALALLVLTVAAGWLLPAPLSGVATLVLHLLAGLEARDRLRARLARQGMPVLGVVAAPDTDLAWFRLGQQRPDLVKAVP
jgi:hypothetical protein